MNPGRRGKISEKPENFLGSLKKLLSYLKAYKMRVLLVIIFAIFSTTLAIIGPKILGNATNTIADGYLKSIIYDSIKESLPKDFDISQVNGEMILKMMPEDKKEELTSSQIDLIKKMDFSVRPSIDFDKVKETLTILLIIYIISAIFSYVQGFIMSRVATDITYTLREELFKKINKLPLKYYDNTTHGEVISRITNDMEILSSNMSQNFSQSIITVTTLIGIIVMMLSISVQMTLVAVLLLPLSILFLGMIIKKSQNYFFMQQENTAKVNGYIEESYSGHIVIKAFNAEEKTKRDFRKLNEKLYETSLKSQFFSGLMQPIINLVGNIGFVGICVLGGYQVIQGKIKIGDIQSFINYVRQFTQNTAQGASIISDFQSMVAAYERIDLFLNEEEETEIENPTILKQINGKVTFDHVKFGYNDNVVIHDFSCEIRPGEKVAIVGPTGAGKTTIVKLLMRFYELNDGKILIDDKDISKYKRKDVRKMVGMVLQDTWVFNGSIKDNIKYGSKHASDKDVIEASVQARVDNFIHTLPDGYDMIINEEGSNISAGEKQLITIARAILADPKILILDEATSSVDTRTEVLITEAMENLMKDRTSFVIAHRLSTIRDADKILVMNDGDIVEVGDHESLLKKNGFYAKLYNSQFEE